MAAEDFGLTDLDVIDDPGIGIGFDTLPEDFSGWEGGFQADSDYVAADSLGDAWWAMKTGDSVIDAPLANVVRDSNTNYPVTAGQGFIKDAINKWGDALGSVIKVGATTLLTKAGAASSGGGSRATTQTPLGSLLGTVGAAGRQDYAKPSAGLPLLPMILLGVALFIALAFIMKGKR